MPITIPEALPAGELLKQEKIFVMDAGRAETQDIRPLRILIVNLMPRKETTELQLLRLLGNTPLQVDITFLRTASYISKNVSKTHLDTFYKTFSEVEHEKFDGMIVTGAPVEQMPFEEVGYWQEIQAILDWAAVNVTSSMHICWGAQAALYHYYGIEKHDLAEKCFGIFDHTVTDPTVNLARGFNDLFPAPHSRHTGISERDVEEHEALAILARSDEAGPFIIVSDDGKNVMITGHLEYDAETLKEEYDRDIAKGFDIAIPLHYYPEDDPSLDPPNTWRSHTHLLFSNWLNYYVYQQTPYDWR
ncbi:homoserine O-succinyltransferase [Sporosarcina sp. NCCP-2716]|uniref:homoserine O-acetyltransferase MetA n=1 Tax=Sporosarcina sp. NCCP-2716 TaxID=2943679 RepID=UPI00203AC5EB|nr:homoserine O-succinyltransferase [Sporosarcina sp. NCCP-2716]GKV69480.1 homoserine O-succinyltransferase [Sporosarcina sp. NCCP-2716]